VALCKALCFGGVNAHQAVQVSLLLPCGTRFHRATAQAFWGLLANAYSASKIVCDDTFEQVIVYHHQGMFALCEINQMECKVCSYLEWQLNVDLNLRVTTTSLVQGRGIPNGCAPTNHPACYILVGTFTRLE